MAPAQRRRAVEAEAATLRDQVAAEAVELGRSLAEAQRQQTALGELRASLEREADEQAEEVRLAAEEASLLAEDAAKLDEKRRALTAELEAAASQSRAPDASGMASGQSSRKRD